jgi:hypothetical protein
VKRDLRTKSQSGFAPIELPLILILLGVFGLIGAWLFHHFRHPLPWCAWPLAFLSLPLLLMSAALFLFGVSNAETRKHSAGLKSANATTHHPANNDIPDIKGFSFNTDHYYDRQLIFSFGQA